MAIVLRTDPGVDNKKQSMIDLSSKSQVPLNNIGTSTAINTLAELDISAMSSSLRWNFPDRPSNIVDLPSIDTLPYLHAEGANPAVWGQGGIPLSGRCDLEALVGRLGRRETCCINAAIMASSWPYKSRNSRRYTKPIIVDIDLPVWTEEKHGAQPEQLVALETTVTRSNYTSSSQSTAYSVSS